MNKTYIIIGGPGSGKGTQSTLLVDKYNFTYISTGELIRESIQNNIVEPDILQKKSFIPDQLMSKMLMAKMSLHIDDDIIIDGFPRAGNQISLLFDLLNKYNRILNGVLYLNVSKDTMYKHLMSRDVRIGESVENKSENCINRIKAYYEETMPIVDALYSMKSINFYTIDGHDTIDNIHNKIINILHNEN